MISDVLFDAVEDINEYLREGIYDRVYQGDLRARIIKLVSNMDQLRQELDTPSAPTALEEWRL